MELDVQGGSAGCRETPDRDCANSTVQILLTNDDGIHAPGLRALSRANWPGWAMCASWLLLTEQSGVAHSITYLSPLVVQEVFEGQRRRGWAVEGSPADCVKIGILNSVPSGRNWWSAGSTRA